MAYILLIEGEEELRGRLAEALQKGGHTVEAVADAEGAGKACKTKVPALLVADERLGEGQVNFLSRMMHDRRLSRIPVILLVDPTDLGAATAVYECDVFAILKKPVEPEHVALQAETVLRQTSRQKQSRKRERNELRSQILRLEREVRSTTTDLADAAQNFVTMLASPPSPKGLHIHLHYSPSGGFIGGDFYDFFWLDQRRLCVVVGDVSGHGIQAAVIQSMARKVISIAMRIYGGNLRIALRFANDELADDIPQGKFVAALVGVLDVTTGEWQHARCGIPHPVFVNPDGSRQDVMTAGTPLGLRRGPTWDTSVEVHTARLQPDSRIVLFSDGIIECLDDDGQEFDYRGIHRVLDRAQPGDNVARAIYDAAHAGHRAVDDVLIISIYRDNVPLDTAILPAPEDAASLDADEPLSLG